MFKQGDYIVLVSNSLNNDEAEGQYPLNFCYKQKTQEQYLVTELDGRGSDRNAWGLYDYDNAAGGKWRYATPQEIKEYDRLGKPYDVTTLKREFQIGDKVRLIKEGDTGITDQVGNIFTIDEITNTTLYILNKNGTLFSIIKNWYDCIELVESIPEKEMVYKPKNVEIRVKLMRMI